MGYCGKSCGSSYRCSALWLSSGRGTSRPRGILDAVEDHIIPHVSGKDFAFQMW
jgi:hypothetical protein